MIPARIVRFGSLAAACLFFSIGIAQDTKKDSAASNRGARSRGRFGDFNAGPTLAKAMIDAGDQNKDGKLSKAEFAALARAWFAKIESGKSSNLNADVFARRFAELLPKTRQSFGPGTFIGQGLFAAADLDKDGVLAREEWTETFARWFDRWDGPKNKGLDETALIKGVNRAWPQPRFDRLFGRNGDDPMQAEIARGADFSEKPPILPRSPEEEAKHFLLPKGYRLEPVLTDPIIEEPVAIAFDGNGRMYVAEMRTYMRDVDAKDELAPRSRVSLHEDTDNDGRYDKHSIFIDNLVLPRLVLPWDGRSVLAMETDADDVFKYTDTDGDGVSDKKEIFYVGVGRRGNLEHQPSGMIWGLDNRIYSTYNAFRLRWTPKGIVKESTAPNGGQWGLTQDDDGKPWFVDAGGERGPVNFQVPIRYGALSVPQQFEEGFEVPWPAPGIGDMQGGMLRIRMPEKNLNHFTAACGPDIFRGDRLPDDLRGDLLFAEPVGRLVRRAKIVVKDGLTQLRNAYPKSEFIRSTDQLFRPVNMTTAPDGTLYIVDMYRGIIQEGTWVPEGSYLRKKVRQYQLDKVTGRGRIWRLTYEGIPRDRTRPRMLDETPAELVKHLEHPNGWRRDSAQKLLVLRQDKSVVPALLEIVRKSGSRVGRFHALWTLEGLGALDAETVREQLKSADARTRVQALRLSESLYFNGDHSLASDIRALTEDSDPSVVMQALSTLNVLKVPDAERWIQTTLRTTKSAGVREIGAMLARPDDAARSTLGFRLNPEQRKLMERGSTIYRELCYTCHGNDGKGAPLAGAPSGITMAPPLAGSSRVTGHPDYVGNVLLHGLVGPIDGKSYESLMASMGTNDDEWIASIASYVRNSFGNSGSFVTPADIAQVRAETASRTFPWTVSELESSLPGALRYRRDWKISAARNSEFAGYAINSPGFVRWDSDGPQEPGIWFQIELPEPKVINEIQLDSLGTFGGVEGYPRGYEVRVSADGKSWSDPVAQGKGHSGTTKISLKPSSARFYRVTLTEATKDGAPWTIQRTRLFEAVKPSSLESRTPRVGSLPIGEVLDSVSKIRGDSERGRRLFAELSCVACHTVKADEPRKGPFLGKIAETYRRRELAEQILSPSKKIAKGFETNIFALKDGGQVQGFVVREDPREILVKTGAAQELKIAADEIDERGKSDKSLMPEGLVAHLTVEEFAALVAYLESLATSKPSGPNITPSNE